MSLARVLASLQRDMMISRASPSTATIGGFNLQRSLCPLDDAHGLRPEPSQRAERHGGACRTRRAGAPAARRGDAGHAGGPHFPGADPRAHAARAARARRGNCAAEQRAESSAQQRTGTAKSQQNGQLDSARQRGTPSWAHPTGWHQRSSNGHNTMPRPTYGP